MLGAGLPPSGGTPYRVLIGVCLRLVSRDAFGEGFAAFVAATALLARSGSSRGRIYVASGEFRPRRLGLEVKGGE